MIIMDMETIADSAVITNTYGQACSEYFSILEKTNQQLSLWTNPYGIMIGALGLIIAIGAVVVAVLLWKNSKDQKERMKTFYDNQDKIIKEKNSNVVKIEKKLQRLMDHYEEKLQSATDVNKEEIEKAIRELGKEKATIGAYLGSAAVIPDGYNFASGIINSSSKEMICSSCGSSFKYYNDPCQPIYISDLSLSTDDKKVHCTFCGAVNIPQ